MFRFTRYVVLLLWLLTNSSEYSFCQSLHFKHLNNENGLSQNTINCIYQDSRGFIWLGTQDGLNRFDGYEFIILRHEQADTNSISHSWIWDILEDSHNNIWIATWNGLTKYNPNANIFTRYFPDPDKPTSMRGGRPTSICEDKYGYLWIGTWGGGLNRFDPTTSEFTHFTNDTSNKSSLVNDFVRTLHLDKNNKLWIGTWNGLSQIDLNVKDNYIFENFQKDNTNKKGSISSNKITSLAKDHEDNLWIGTFEGGLNQYDPATGTFTYFFHDTSDTSLGSNNIGSLLTDKKGRLWIGTISNGVDIFDNKRKEFIHIKHDPDDDQSLSGNNVYSIFEDQSGIIWIGAGGVNLFNYEQENFKHFKHSTSKKTSLSNNKVTSFYEDSSGDIWIGTENGGLDRFCPEQQSFSAFLHNPNDPNSISSNSISSIAEDENGCIWIGTRGGGLNKFDKKSSEFTQYLESEQIPESEGLNFINGICYDSPGTLWIATFDKGLIKFDIHTESYTNFRSNPGDSTTLSGDYILRIYKKDYRYLWIGIWGGGLNAYDLTTNSFIRFMNDPARPKSISGNIVHYIYETSNKSGKTIWVGTSEGLSYMQISDTLSLPGKFDHFFIEDGLPGNVIYAILEDNSGNLWLSSNQGLSKLNPRTKTFKNYDRSDGLQSNEFNAGACLKLKNGQLLFGGINGFNIFHPDSIKVSSFNPPLVFTSFKVFNKPLFPGTYLPNEKYISLSYKQNFFSFEFAALDYRQSSKNQYAYKMEGIDDDWVMAGTRHYASYTKIEPGEYKFMIKGTNGDGVWSKNTSSLTIRIKPPYWKTWWSKILAVMLVIFVFYMYHMYRLNKLLEIERLRTQIASDLHDDIGSALTKIAIHSEQIQTGFDKNKILISSKKIGILSREVISTMSDIIWSIDSRNDTLIDLLDRMRDLAHDALTMKDINVSFQTKGFGKNKKIPVTYRQNIFYIFKEAINNILKHANANEVKIELKLEEKNFFMQIADNGIGFDPNEKKKGNGLKNMKMRADRIGGLLRFTSSNGFRILLKIRWV